MSDFCAATHEFQHPSIESGRHTAICELPEGHEEPHQEGPWRWVTYMEVQSLESYMAEFEVTPDEEPFAFKEWVLATTGWGGDD